MSIAQLSFLKQASPTPAKRRLIVSIMGREKQGKTHVGFTAPGPIAAFDFDYGQEGVIHKFAKDKRIYTSEFRIGEISAEKFNVEWERYKKEYRAALNEKELRSLIIDTNTELWELARMAKFGKLTQVMPHQYGPVNAEMRGLIRDAYSSDKNVIFLHKMSEQYVNNSPTGRYVMAGFKDTPYSVQVNCLVWREEGGGDFHLEVTDCRQNPDVAGMDLTGDMCNFQTLATMIFPDSNEKDWS